MLRVVIADDSYLVREGVVQLLAGEPGIEVVASCADGDELREAIELEAPDVVLTDIRMPPSGEQEGLEVADELRASRPGVGVVVVSQYASSEYALRLLASGAEGRAYLLKQRLGDRRQLIAALRAVAGGGAFVDTAVIEELVPGRTAASRLAGLTPREAETLSLVAEGMNNEAIAERLVLTRRAVEKNVNSIFQKLGVSGEEEVSPRVKAALIYLADRDGGM